MAEAASGTAGPVREARSTCAGSEQLVPCPRRCRESEGERLRRRRERTLPDRQPAERPQEGSGRNLGGQYLRRRFCELDDRSRLARGPGFHEWQVEENLHDFAPRLFATAPG